MKNQFLRYASLLFGRNGSKAGDAQGRAGEPPVGDLVPMSEASLLAYISAYGIDATITRIHRNDMAESLAQLLAVYAVAEDGRTVRRVHREEFHGAIFSEGGRIVRFRDQREAITGLAVTRDALKAAVAALKDTKKPSGFNR